MGLNHLIETKRFIKHCTLSAGVRGEGDRRQQNLGFPGGSPIQVVARPNVVNFSDQMGTGVSNMVNPLTMVGIVLPTADYNYIIFRYLWAWFLSVLFFILYLFLPTIIL